MNFQAGQMIPQYETKLFTDIYPNEEGFLNDYNALPAGLKLFKNEESVKTLFYLLYARYGNNPIANYDETQFKYKLFSIAFQYGPTWEKRLELQSELRQLSIEDAATGALSIYNHAFNPETGPSTNATGELNFVSDQNVSKYRKAPLEAASNLWDMLRVDVTELFIKHFSSLFLKIVRPQHTYIYTTEED